MGISYTVKVRRKEDGAVIAEFFANELKSIEAFRLGFDGPPKTGSTFSAAGIDNAAASLRKEIGAAYGDIQKMELESLIARPETRREILKDVDLRREDVSYLMDQLEQVSILAGKLRFAVEDQIFPDGGGEDAYGFDSRMAYVRNGKDGKGLWTSDVECEVEASC